MSRLVSLYPLTFEPQVLEKVWGGSKLVELFGKPTGHEPIGESWEVSTVPGRESVVDTGPLAGRRLDRLVEEFGAELVGTSVFERHGPELPLLLKLIDASDDLSVQVHPHREAAARLGRGARAKAEAWLVLAADPGARLVLGVAEGIDRERFVELARAGRVAECLRSVEARAGDVVPVEPGTLHAIGKGVVLLELQESSDTTFRVYDYDRPGLDGKPRQLHVDEALASMKLESGPAVVAPRPLGGPGRRELLHRDAAIEMQRWTFRSPITLEVDPARFWLLTTLAGSVTLETRSPAPSVPLPTGRSALLPAGLSVNIVPAGETVLFLGTVPRHEAPFGVDEVDGMDTVD
jgi:mannose-6-phosphate isomerase